MNSNYISTCKALVPMEVMDVQAMALLNSINNPKTETETPEQKNRKHMASIRTISRDSTIEGALTLLDAMGYRKDVFHHEGAKWEVRDLTDESYFPDLPGRFASETPVFWFWGGPPTKLHWYEGTLQTMLDDRIMCEVIDNGAEIVAALMGLDLETNNEFTHNQKRGIEVRV
jgi:hypothetical protein